MKDLNQYTITPAVKDSFKTVPGSRLEQLLQGLITHLHDFTREQNVTHEEWMATLNFLYDCGQISTPERHEFILLSDVLGWSALVDMINTKGGATEGSNLGPFYLDDAPTKALGADLSDDRSGVTVLMHGRVMDTLKNPLPGAQVDTWQADGAGTYPIQEQGQDKYDLRGKFTCDAGARYYYTTVLPKPYTVPYDGPVGQLLRAGNRHAWRAPHMHFIVTAPGMSGITTEVFFKNTDYIDNDAVFGVRGSLIAEIKPAKDLDKLGYTLDKTPDAVIEFDFVLAPGD
ncbi:dioxygenase [Roseicyclus sp.]|uniref:dioxygenase family protein n=1 Tax=Roseicyclus sp. TaxID=1914329 RepID=UPI003F6D691A